MKTKLHYLLAGMINISMLLIVMDNVLPERGPKYLIGEVQPSSIFVLVDNASTIVLLVTWVVALVFQQTRKLLLPFSQESKNGSLKS